MTQHRHFSQLFDLMVWDSDYSWKYKPVELTIERFDDYDEVNLQLPGVKKKDITVKIENRYLTIEAIQNDKYKIDTTFKNTWKLNEGVDSEKITLKLDAGILTIILPKKEEAKSITLSVK